MSRLGVNDIKSRKGSDNKIVCIAAYTFPMAKIIDEFCDVILVGDSLGMTVYGMENTLGVTTSMMINHGKAVVNATKKSMIVVDLPFGSYEKSPQQAFKTASNIISKTNCDAVKLEMSEDLIDTVRFLASRSIPVIAHVGLTPQHVNKLGGFKVQGKEKKSAEAILDLAIKSETAGAFCIVIEGVIEELATRITNVVDIPTIGIGASINCDGQVLVIDDILGIEQEYSPKFVKRYAKLSSDIEKSVHNFSNDVKNKKFPEKSHCFFVKS